MGHVGNPRSFRLSHRRKGQRLMGIPGLLDHKLKSWLIRGAPSRFTENVSGLGLSFKSDNLTHLKRWFGRFTQTPRVYQNKVRRALVHAHPGWHQLWFNKHNYSSSFFSFLSANSLFSSKKSFFNFTLRKKVQRRASPGGFFSHSIVLDKPDGRVLLRPFYVSKYLNNLKQYYPDYTSVTNYRLFSEEQKSFLKGSLLYERKAFAQPRASEKARFPHFRQGGHVTKYFNYRVFLEAVQANLYHLLADNIGRRAYLSEVINTPYKHYQKPDAEVRKVTIRTGPGRFHKEQLYFPSNMNIKVLKDINLLRPLLQNYFIKGVGISSFYFAAYKRNELSSFFLKKMTSSVKKSLSERGLLPEETSYRFLFNHIISRHPAVLQAMRGVISYGLVIPPRYGFFTKEFVEQLDKRREKFDPRYAKRIFTKKGMEETFEKVRQQTLLDRKEQKG